MRAPTRKRLIKKRASFRPKMKQEEDSIHWKDAFKEAFGDESISSVTLRGLRNREGWTQSELGEKIGVNQANLSKMENGTRVIGKNIAKRLADVFKTDYRMFL